MESHFIALAAEESRLNGGKVIELEEFKKKSGALCAHTTLENSMESHFIALAAEESRLNGGKVIELESFKNRK